MHADAKTVNSQSFQALYNNFDGIENTFINYWRHAAKRFKDNPFVLGYGTWRNISLYLLLNGQVVRRGLLLVLLFALLESIVFL